MDNAIIDLAPVARPIEDYEARVNITWAAQNGDLPDPVAYDTPDDQLKTMLVEAITTGSIPGLRADANVDLRDFVVDRFEATEARPWRAIMVRPKTAFGG